ncbi:uncharacterized protein LOC120295696 [Eucalyptus grandis]|uniref:uncharacterized protein LOC120295286 n=1 Tax=Eucalyptus grandis TaxID=71139 RepID=UPI00192EACF7|nr:uncharacterized protein LOC120295286 [Eucalyptus grandis]XP_039172985.1 uncharacterized protein LOC120295696 [Eucalyptus grandis]XP_039172986.1 uncharacterized protein LOC120295696 [Eucalyptus grandis]
MTLGEVHLGGPGSGMGDEARGDCTDSVICVVAGKDADADFADDGLAGVGADSGGGLSVSQGGGSGVGSFREAMATGCSYVENRERLKLRLRLRERVATPVGDASVSASVFGLKGATTGVSSCRGPSRRATCSVLLCFMAESLKRTTTRKLEFEKRKSPLAMGSENLRVSIAMMRINEWMDPA